MAALGYRGFHTGRGLLAMIGLGIGAPLMVTLVRVMIGAPNSQWQLHDPTHLVLEAVVFGAAAVALLAADQPRLGLVLELVLVLNRAFMHAWAQ